jgi:hypothetical protein
MTVLLTALVVLAIPCLALSALLVFIERREDRRQLTRDRQIALVDAIHSELGAVAAPTVTRRRGGGWRVSMLVPLERPAVVADLLRLTATHFAAERTAERLEIVLSPDSFQRWSSAALPKPSRPVASGRPLAA